MNTTAKLENSSQDTLNSDTKCMFEGTQATLRFDNSLELLRESLKAIILTGMVHSREMTHTEIKGKRKMQEYSRVLNTCPLPFESGTGLSPPSSGM